MKKSYLIMAAIASVALVSCSNEEYLGDPGGLTGERAISFDMSTPAMTRDEKTGEAAAEELDYSFQVYATKTVGTTTSNVFATNTYAQTMADANSDSKLDGAEPYWAWYVENTAGKTNSNLNNWEYVGGAGTHGKTGHQITIDAGKDQTIKYWDRSAGEYSFMAFKAKTVTSGTATISNVTPSGFTVTGTPDQLANLYVAKKEVFKKENETGNVYGNPVRFTFRNFVSKIRFGIYENIPGYKVKIKNVHYNSTSSNENFGVTGKFSASSNQSYNVTYDNTTGIAIGESPSGDTQTYFESTNSTILSATEIGTPATGATYDKADNAYSIIMPNPTNNTGMTLTVDITLTSEGGSGETIELTKASATVPANYCQWQSNFAYTYLFKISDLTQFQEGQLSPITLDAVVTDDGQGNQNTITIVETPSITTYQAGKVIYDDYVATAGDIFATVEDANGALKTLTTTANLATSTLETVGNASLFTISHNTQTNFTEAEIEKALLVRTSALTKATVEGRNGISLTPATLTLTHKIVTQSGEQTVSEGETYKAAKFTPEAPTAPATVKSYAFVYTVTGSSDADKETKYEAVPGLTAGTSSVANYYWYYEYVTDVDAIEGATYYTRGGSDPDYTYTTATPDPAFFLGDDATGLYIDDPANAGQYIAATGKVRTGVTYYSDANGASASTRIIAYANFASTALYVLNGEHYELKGESAFDPTKTYYLDAGTTRVYILPENIGSRNTKYYRLVTSESIQKCPASEIAADGKRYYDKYTMYKGKYAVKVIKVQ